MAKKGKPAKDPNKPKRPPSAFFVFMEEFRVTYKHKHPPKKICCCSDGEKWKSLTDEAPYIQKEVKRKPDYEKSMNTYNKKLAEGKDAEKEEESVKSMSEVNDEDDEAGSG